MARKETVREIEKTMKQTLGKYMEELDRWRKEMKKEVRIWREEMKE